MQKTIDLLKKALARLRVSHGKRLSDLERRVIELENSKVDRWNM